MRTILIAIAFATAAGSAWAEPCPFAPWSEYQGTKLLRVADGSAYLFSPREVKVDADGAPNAYHPDDVGMPCTSDRQFKGLDCPKNAGYPNSSWWPSVLVPDPTNRSRPYVQPSSSEFAGYFVSMTALHDPSRAVTDPKRYVDSRIIPYVVFPRSFHGQRGTGTLGDLGYALHLDTGRQSPFVVAEIGPTTAQLGEISIALATAMGGIDPNPRTGRGVSSGRIAYLVFPRSAPRPPWPIAMDQLAARVSSLLSATGGVEAIRACRDAF